MAQERASAHAFDAHREFLADIAFVSRQYDRMIEKRSSHDARGGFPAYPLDDRNLGRCDARHELFRADLPLYADELLEAVDFLLARDVVFHVEGRRPRPRRVGVGERAVESDSLHRFDGFQIILLRLAGEPHYDVGG